MTSLVRRLPVAAPAAPSVSRRRRRLSAGVLAAVALTAVAPLVATTVAPAQAVAPSVAAPVVRNEVVTFVSNGVKLVGHRYSASQATKRPIIVMAPGAGAYQTGHLLSFAKEFAAAGYDTFSFDYGSWGESDGLPRNVLDIQAQLADWRAAIAKARTLPAVDTTKVVLWGSSLAGGHVLQTAAGDHQLAAVISQVPQVDGLASTAGSGKPLDVLAKLAGLALQDSVNAFLGKPPVYIPTVGMPGDVAVLTGDGAYYGYTHDAPPGWVNKVAARIILQIPLYSPKNVAAQSTAPTFIGVADKDNLAVPAPAMALAGTMGAELHVYQGGHFDQYVGEKNYAAILADELAFLRAHVPAARTR